LNTRAEVAELADALGSGPSGLTMPVEVQVLSSALCGLRGCVEGRNPLVFASLTIALEASKSLSSGTCSTYRVIFRLQGKQYFVMVGKVSAQEAESKTAQIDYLLMRRLGEILRDLGDSTGAVAEVRQALTLCQGLPPRSGYEFETACCHAALAGLAGRAAWGEAEAASAMEWLQLAVAMGYRNANELRIESALDPLRSRRDFQLLMMDVALPADPFARGR
jgi:hypothetical protein